MPFVCAFNSETFHHKKEEEPIKLKLKPNSPAAQALHKTDINSHPERVAAVDSKFVLYSRKLVGISPPISHEFHV